MQLLAYASVPFPCVFWKFEVGERLGLKIRSGGTAFPASCGTLSADRQRACNFRSLTVINTCNGVYSSLMIVSAYRYIAITNLPITPVFVAYIGQFLIDFNQIYRHGSVPKTRLPQFLELLSSSGFRARRRRDFFCHFMPVTV